MTKAKRTKLSISDQLVALDEAVAFIEQTADIDAAIDRYEAALKISRQLSLDLQARSVRIETIRLTQSMPLPA